MKCPDCKKETGKQPGYDKRGKVWRLYCQICHSHHHWPEDPRESHEHADNGSGHGHGHG